MHLQMAVYLGGSRATALLDSGASGNFVDPRYLSGRNIHCRKKTRTYELQSLGDQPVISQVQDETRPAELRIGRHREQISFDVTELGGYDLVLGYPWLKLHNPVINWQEEKLQQ